MTRFRIRQRLLREARVVRERARNLAYDFASGLYPDYREQLRRAQLVCNAAQADIEPDLWNGEPWSKDNDYVVKEIEKPAWTLKTRRGPEEVPYSFVQDEPETPTKLERYIMGEEVEEAGCGHQGNAAAGYEFEQEMMLGCRNQDGDADGNCPGQGQPDTCETVPSGGCPLLEEELA